MFRLPILLFVAIYSDRVGLQDIFDNKTMTKPDTCLMKLYFA